jgi:uridine kinase
MTEIKHSQPRDSVRVTFPDGTVLEGPLGTPLEAFMRAQFPTNDVKGPPFAVIADGALRELSHPVQRDASVRPLHLADSDGSRIYRRSLVLLLTTAADELFPTVRVNVRYSVPNGGFYCSLLNRAPFSADELAQLEAHMHSIAAADAPITKRSVPLDEVIALYSARDEEDKVRLLEQRTRAQLTLYTLRGRADYYYGYMLPSTGYLTHFRLVLENDGFILQFPRPEAPDTMPQLTTGKLTAVFHQADEHLRVLGVEDIGQMNGRIRHGRAPELVLVAEALHDQDLAQIANDIQAQHHARGVRLVLIAGPSSSGKTTFARRLAVQLLAKGLRPLTLELDNYFVNREQTPRDTVGEYDFESLHAIDLPRFNADLLALFDGARVQTPHFDFRHGKSGPGRTLQLHDHDILIIEGIHGLNPELVPQIPSALIYRVYISALTPLNIDSHNRIPTTDLRLLRRIVRDARTRGYNAADTLSRWASVRRGERRNIFPYQENADALFNSALVYELAALRPLVEPLLLNVDPHTPQHIEAKRLLMFLRWVQPLSPEQIAIIPNTSLLREFIGGSNVLDFIVDARD